MRGNSNSLFHLRGQASMPKSTSVYLTINIKHLRGSSSIINRSYLRIKRKNSTDHRGTHLKN